MEQISLTTHKRLIFAFQSALFMTTLRILKSLSFLHQKQHKGLEGQVQGRGGQWGKKEDTCNIFKNKNKFKIMFMPPQNKNKINFSVENISCSAIIINKLTQIVPRFVRR